MARRKNPYTADAKTRAAKAAGYPARSVFKLQEIDRRTKLFKPGMRVLDLGAAPGSWSLYASQKVGPAGRVFAVDLKEIPQSFAGNVEVLVGDALDLENDALNRLGPYDVVMSDMAPNTSGSKERDQALSYELVVRALAVATALGKVGSHFVAKLFMGPDFPAARQLVTERYHKCQVIRPAGTRQQSSELFLVGQGKREGVPAV